jgi:4-amino-4-deoxy-L-arabinose transferase-like glycosyltransferase
MRHLPAPTNRIISTIFLVCVFGLMALVPRALGLADFFTTDEAYHWIDRTARFHDALRAGSWSATIQTGHPGVTTMWLGTIGRMLEAAFPIPPPPASSTPLLLEHLAWLRLPGAVVHALVIALAFIILRKLVDRTAAFVATVLWATAPYLIAHGRVLHLDALLTDFVSLSLLLLLCACENRPRAMDDRPGTIDQGQPAGVSEMDNVEHGWRPRVWFLIASGLCAGLALLTKGPALILLPFVGLTLFCYWMLQDRPPVSRTGPSLLGLRSWVAGLGSVIGWYLLWLGCGLIVVYALWPALWSDPGRALGRYIGEITINGGRPNGDGQFFLGRAVGDPGPLFYLLADLYRTTPAMLLGLAAGIGVWMRCIVHRNTGSLQGARLISRPVLGVLIAFVLFWTLVMTFGPKKFDRYVLPTWPMLLILAAAGWSALFTWLRRPRFRTAMLVLIVATELGQCAWYHPYYLSYYNPLLGGGAAAQRLFLVGWGEGMDQAGAYLRSRADLSYGPVLSALGETLQPFVPVDVRDVTDFGTLPANYAVVYIESIQRAADPPLYARLQTTVPLAQITIHGIEYALIYQLPRPFEQPIDATFGTALRLRGVTIQREQSRLTVLPAWDVQSRPESDYRVFVHLLDASGQRVAQIDVAPGGDNAPPTSQWEAGQQISVPLPLGLPSDLPAGSYQLVMGVYETPSTARLTLTGGTLADPAIAGDNALVLETVVVP